MSKPPDLSDVPDLELMARAREGDQDAYCELERRYRSVVFDVIYGVVRQREQAEDLTQEALVKLFGALDSNGPERHPSAWIRRMANNTALDYVRRRRKWVQRLRPNHRRVTEILPPLYPSVRNPAASSEVGIASHPS